MNFPPRNSTFLIRHLVYQIFVFKIQIYSFFSDLSRNKFVELPPECTSFRSLERLLLYHNSIRAIPEEVVHLRALKYLDLR